MAIGSIVIPAGRLFNPCFLDAHILAARSLASIDLNILISGVSAFFTRPIGSGIGGPATPIIAQGRFIIGSPMSGLVQYLAHASASQVDLANETLSQVNQGVFSNFDPSVATVITLSANNFSAAGSVSIPFYIVQGLGSSG